MSGLFADWQPRYAERGIATFPVRDKVPAVKGYLKVGLSVSEQLSMRFLNDNAFGFACKRSRITVLDIDAPDEKLLADALDTHGSTPIVVRSGSGNYQAWYRHNGESRKVRPIPDKPIDILGDGFVVAPPSIGSRGSYSFIEGGLDDVEHLPFLKGSIFNPNKKQNTPLPSPSFIGTSRSEKGTRNDTLWRECMKMARGCHGLEELMEKAMELNMRYHEPMPADEVLKTVCSAWGYEVEGKNWFGHGKRVVVGHGVIDELAASNPRAFALLSLLKRHHWGRDFYLSKSYAASLGWAENTLKAARDALVAHKLIECIHPGGRGPNDPPVYRFARTP